MDYTRAEAMTRSLTRDGGLLDYGSARSRLLVRVLQTLAGGRAVTNTQVDHIIDLLGMDRNEADAFLRALTERDASDRIIGILGLSLGDHPNRVLIDGQRMATWCAVDTLFLPALLGRTAVIESKSLLSRETVRLRVGPSGVESVSPVDAVVSMVILDPANADLQTLDALWRTFCRHVNFFSSRAEGTQWIGERRDMALLTPDEAYRIGRLLVHRCLAEVG